MIHGHLVESAPSCPTFEGKGLASIDLKGATKVLDRDHYGLEKVKERILEHLAVLKLKGDMKSPIICLASNDYSCHILTYLIQEFRIA